MRERRDRCRETQQQPPLCLLQSSWARRAERGCRCHVVAGVILVSNMPHR